jgi:hypothetical protein
MGFRGQDKVIRTQLISFRVIHVHLMLHQLHPVPEQLRLMEKVLEELVMDCLVAPLLPLVLVMCLLVDNV